MELAGPAHAHAAGAAGLASGSTAADPPSPPPPNSAALWRRFYREQTRRNMRGDKLAAAIMVAVSAAARLQVGEHQTMLEEVHSGAVLALSTAVMLAADDIAEHDLLVLRGALVLALKLVAATAPLFRLSVIMLVQTQPQHGESRASLTSSALLRVLLGDHTALLLFMGTAMQQVLAMEAATQAAFLASLVPLTGAICSSPYLGRCLQEWHVPQLFPRPKKVCIVFVVFLQLTLGVLTPLIRVARRESAAAMRFAEEHGVPPGNLRLRAYRVVDRATSWDDPLAWRVAATTALAAVLAACTHTLL